MLSKYLQAFRDIIWPRLCFCCERKITAGYLCPECQEKIEYLNPPLCQLCSNPLKHKNTIFCPQCVKKDSPLKRTVSITAYKEPMVTLLHLFKYKNYDYLAEFFAGLMIPRLLKLGVDLSSYELIVPVPMHPFKQKERGYNQAKLLADKIANHFQIPLRDDIIYQKKDKPSQTKLKKQQREKAMEGIFAVREDLKGKNIVLVDDILTTASTIRECALALKLKGAGQITAITLAKTLN